MFWNSCTAWLLKMGPTGCPGTSVLKYHSTLRVIPAEYKYHLHQGRKPEILHILSLRLILDLLTFLVCYWFSATDCPQRRYRSGECPKLQHAVVKIIYTQQSQCLNSYIRFQVTSCAVHWPTAQRCGAFCHTASVIWVARAATGRMR